MSETVLLVIDIGNTNVSVGIYDYKSSDDATLSEHWRLSTRSEQTSDELTIALGSLFSYGKRRTAEITEVIISSVVPPVVPIWERACVKLFDRKPYVVGPGIRTGMPVRYDNPHEVGADRIANAVAAYEKYGGPVVAVDFGTATTFDCISADGEYMGGVIFPGIHISMNALFDRASKLHEVEIIRPRSVIGKTTTSALQSGILFGYAGLVDSMIGRIREELGTESKVIATGGLAGRIAQESQAIETVEPFLTLEGLRILFEKNR